MMREGIGLYVNRLTHMWDSFANAGVSFADTVHREREKKKYIAEGLAAELILISGLD